MVVMQACRWIAGLCVLAALGAAAPASARTHTAYGCKPGHRPPEQSGACHRVALVRGGPARVAHGVIRTTSDRFSFCFRARKGETLIDTIRGAAVRLVLTSPDGSVDGPGLPGTLPLAKTGRYKLTVSPNLMADGALGAFTLTLRLK